MKIVKVWTWSVLNIAIVWTWSEKEIARVWTWPDLEIARVWIWSELEIARFWTWAVLLLAKFWTWSGLEIARVWIWSELEIARVYQPLLSVLPIHWLTIIVLTANLFLGHNGVSDKPSDSQHSTHNCFNHLIVWPPFIWITLINNIQCSAVYWRNQIIVFVAERRLIR